MKKCIICGNEIINGVNGCAMYGECTDCRPIRYYALPKRLDDQGDYEEAILSRQEDFEESI